MVRRKISLKKGDQNAQRWRMPITLGEYFPKGFLREDQIENVNMTSLIEIEDKDVTKEVEILAKPTKDNGSSVELDLSSLESIIHSLFELPQEARRLLVDVLQECDDRRGVFSIFWISSGDFNLSFHKAFLALIKNHGHIGVQVSLSTLLPCS
ncbi:hypothetical protein ACH5RR_018033 [Cinchona calisaya]|uniref:Uncharacterized protein n=1 Tax=Cinchona calisaya TaxID=153742 RepID=A0ABD2ZK98_9GENT